MDRDIAQGQYRATSYDINSAGFPTASTSYSTGSGNQGVFQYPRQQTGQHDPYQAPNPHSAGGEGPNAAYTYASAMGYYPHPGTQPQSLPAQPSLQQSPSHNVQPQPLSPHINNHRENQVINAPATSHPTDRRSFLAAKRKPVKIEQKSLLEAYILCIPLGFLGLHHFYLGRLGIGFLYLFTLGLFGIGWLIDCCRLPWLVAKTNEKRREDAERGYLLYGGPFDELYERSMCSAYLFWLAPVGIIGGHHYYLGRIGYGIMYSCTLGLLGVGWLFDFCRIWLLTMRANREIRTLRSGKPISKSYGDRIYLDDAYMLAFPLGFLGLHHFYMRRWMFGITYLLTMGCLGVGFIVDLIRLPWIFARAKGEMKNNEAKFHLDDAYLMWFPLGVLGLHHFYLHRWAWGGVYFLTFGFLGLGWLVDFFLIPGLVNDANNSQPESSLLNNQYHPDAMGGNYGTAGGTNPTVQPKVQHNMSAYAFPLDEHGNLIWAEGVPWTEEPARDTNPMYIQQRVGSENVEPPPAYTQVVTTTVVLQSEENGHMGEKETL